MIDVNRIKVEEISEGLKKNDKKNCSIIHSGGETESSAALKRNKVKIDSIFMNIEYIRCPVTKVIVVNSNLFKGG